MITMKKYIPLLTTVLFFGCATKPIKLYESDLQSTEIAIITTKCDRKCRDLIGNHLGSPLGFSNKYDLSEGALLEIDGKVGRREYKNSRVEGKIFNSSWDGRVNLEVAAGEHELLMDANSRLVWSKPERFKVILQGGHVYVIGRVRVEKVKNRIYTWFPLVYDLTNDEILISSLNVNGKNYNSSRMDKTQW